MKIISWNVNSIRIRKQQLLKLIKNEDPDFVCLQEIKSSNDAFPNKDFEDLKYFIHINGMPSYNGVGILSKHKVDSTHSHIFCGKKDSRHIEVKYKGIRIHSIYVPAGGEIPDVSINEKFKHKIKFLAEMKKFLNNNDTNIVAGDLNIAPYEDDVWSHKQLKNVVSHTEIERTKLLDILESGNFLDTFRELLSPSENLFTWWSYRSPDFQKNNRGRRLDHIWANKNNRLKLKKVRILKEYRELVKPSDHVPIILEVKI
jgi:exodeoxyribonuclease-3|tara:strand:- start:79 stop:852 length:774 start_codon:yes stop_codon:yes gene_type:complete